MRRAIPAIIALAVVVAACGGAEIAERVLEGQEGVTDVEIDDDGELKIEVEGEDGDTSAVFGGGEMPADFPIPAPGGGDIQAVIESGTNSSVTIDYPEADFDALLAFYEDWISSNGLNVQSKSEINDPRLVNWLIEDGSTVYTIAISEGFGNTVVSLVVASN